MDSSFISRCEQGHMDSSFISRCEQGHMDSSFISRCEQGHIGNSFISRCEQGHREQNRCHQPRDCWLYPSASGFILFKIASATLVTVSSAIKECGLHAGFQFKSSGEQQARKQKKIMYIKVHFIFRLID